jgi:DNA-binding NarL/FixJ family response regulator
MSDSSHEKAHPAQHNLSDLEVRVLTEIARGITNTEVALRLYIYDDAVKRHFRSAMRKVGVRDQAEARAWAKRYLNPAGLPK